MKKVILSLVISFIGLSNGVFACSYDLTSPARTDKRIVKYIKRKFDGATEIKIINKDFSHSYNLGNSTCNDVLVLNATIDFKIPGEILDAGSRQQVENCRANVRFGGLTIDNLRETICYKNSQSL
jgi:hypothetical protein